MAGQKGDARCRQCRELQHTSRTQVAWRCRWHSEEPGGDVLRCHVLPESPACVHFAPRLADDDALWGPARLASMLIARGMPVHSAIEAAGILFAS